MYVQYFFVSGLVDNMERASSKQNDRKRKTKSKWDEQDKQR